MLLSTEEFFMYVREYSVLREHSVLEGLLNREAGPALDI